MIPLSKILTELNISEKDFDVLNSSTSVQERESHLNQLQRKVKQSYKRAARRLHPDCTDDPASIEMFVLISEFVEHFMKLKVSTKEKKKLKIRISI